MKLAPTTGSTTVGEYFLSDRNGLKTRCRSYKVGTLLARPLQMSIESSLKLRLSECLQSLISISCKIPRPMPVLRSTSVRMKSRSDTLVWSVGEKIPTASIKKETMNARSEESTTIQLHFSSQQVKVQNYWSLKEGNKQWVSKPRFTTAGYKYCLVVMPNGLKHAEGYGESVGVWLNPMRGDKDDQLDWPAEVWMSLRIQSSKKDMELEIPKMKYSWARSETKHRYPAFNFDLTTFTHDVVESQCLSNGNFFIIIDEK